MKSCPKTIKTHTNITRASSEIGTKSESENSSFNALVFACSGGTGPSASRAMNQLATKISEKREEPYADTISYTRTKISSALLSCVLCLRECRALKPRVLSEISISAVVEEGSLH